MSIEKRYHDMYSRSRRSALPSGTAAPDFTLWSTPDQWLTLGEMLGQPVVLAFYPADWSPVCGDQMTLYNEILPEFQNFGAELVGISVDGAWCQAAFARVVAIDTLLAFRHFPLTNVHPHAEHAREAAEKAGAQRKFWEMHEMLFENQDALDDESLVQYTAALGLDEVGLIREVLAGAYARRVREDFMSGVRGGVNGTPTFFIKGKRYDGARGLEPFLAAHTHPEAV